LAGLEWHQSNCF